MERIINKPALIDPHWSWNCQIGEIRYNAANLYNSTSYTIPQKYSIYFICTQFEMKPTIQHNKIIMNKNIFVEKKIVETIFEKKNLYLRYGKYISL